jgi:hypothetical protein
MKNKLGVVVPYRLRKEHLENFTEKMGEYLKNQGIYYEIFVIDQDNGKQFNRGMLLNIGFKEAVRRKCNYVVFHDVDMIPIDVDYSYSEVPLHLATDVIKPDGEPDKEIFDEYFGGVTMFPVKLFEKVNGYSNKYWAWGYEDTDLLFRCKELGLPLDTLKLKNQGREGKTLKFYGKSSKVICKNVIDFNSNATFFISFYPEDLECNHLRESDEFTVFSVPGYDFAICYSSFSRYNFCAFDYKMKALYVNSKIKTNYKTNITVTIDRLDNIIKVYQDGEFIGQTEGFKKLYFYKREPNFYLGVGRPDREGQQNYFKGVIHTFAYYDELLSEKEIKEISNNTDNLLNEDFGDYKSSEFLKTYYETNHIRDYKLIDLSGNYNEGVIKDCGMENFDFDEYKEVKIPHRRKSTFLSLKHDDSGFVDGRWKDQATRWNQIRYYNEVVKNRLIYEDGLSDLKYIEHDRIKEKNVTIIKVGL